MAVLTCRAITSTWLALVGAAGMGNGDSQRLQVGRTTISSTGVTWTNRSIIGWYPIDVGLPLGAVVSNVMLELVVRGPHTCYDNGSGPAIYVERGSPTPAFDAFVNHTAGECSVGTSGAGGNYPGFATTTTNRVGWSSGAVVNGDVASIDITAMFNNWWATGDPAAGKPFPVMLKAQSETTGSQRVAFHSSGAPTDQQPRLIITYTTGATPTAPDTGRSPVTGSVALGTTTRAFQGTYADADPADMVVGPATVEITVADNTAYTAPVHSASAAPTYNATSHVWSTTRTFTQVRGTLYYWRYRVTDTGGHTSAWSSNFSYVVNRLPVPVKVRPT